MTWAWANRTMSAIFAWNEYDENESIKLRRTCIRVFHRVIRMRWCISDGLLCSFAMRTKRTKYVQYVWCCMQPLPPPRPPPLSYTHTPSALSTRTLCIQQQFIFNSNMYFPSSASFFSLLRWKCCHRFLFGDSFFRERNTHLAAFAVTCTSERHRRTAWIMRRRVRQWTRKHCNETCVHIGNLLLCRAWADWHGAFVLAKKRNLYVKAVNRTKWKIFSIPALTFCHLFKISHFLSFRNIFFLSSHVSFFIRFYYSAWICHRMCVDVRKMRAKKTHIQWACEMMFSSLMNEPF